MCGRAYKTFTEEELYFQYLSKRPLNLIDFAPRLFRHGTRPSGSNVDV